MGVPTAIQKAVSFVRAMMRDAWRSPEQSTEPTLFDGCSQAERVAITSGSRPSMIKATDRKISDAEFWRRREDYNRSIGGAA